MSKNFIISNTSELIMIPYEALIYVSASGNYSSLFTADGNEVVVTLQLGQIEENIINAVDKSSNSFIRIGKSLIINKNYIYSINVTRQKLVMSDCRTFRYELNASKEALKALRAYIEKEL